MQAEVESLRQGGLVSAITQFPGGRSLRYVIESSPASVTPAAFYGDGEVIVRLPETAVLAWASSEQVSIDAEQLLDDGATLRILVEKDFACLSPRDGEDESDMYAHPDANQQADR